jgi:hypothetical protein
MLTVNFFNPTPQVNQIVNNSSPKNLMNEEINVTHPADLQLLNTDSTNHTLSWTLADLHINADLVGGFLHALQSFGMELSASETSMKTLSYENYQFQIETGEYTRTALILRGPPNPFLISRLQEFVKQFELSFKTQIVQFTGNIDPFKGVNAIFETVFK